MPGPILIDHIREYLIAQGLPKAQAYDVTMYMLASEKVTWRRSTAT